MLLGLFVGQSIDITSNTQSKVEESYDSAALSWKVAVVFSTAGLGDDSWNDQVYKGLVEAKNRWRIDFEYSEPSQISQYESHLRNFLENPSYSEPYDLVICVGYDQQVALESVAADYPSQYFAIVEATPDTITYPNIAALRFDVAEGAALVGAMAGLMTVANNVSFIGGFNVPWVNLNRDGFIFGAEYYNPTIISNYEYTNDWVDTTTAQNLADELYSGGTDIIYTFAGRAEEGVFTSAKNNNGTPGFDNPLWVIGSDTRRMYLGCADPENPTAPTVALTTMIMNATPGIVSVISHVLNGTFTGGIKVQNAESKGVHIEIRSELLEIPQNILDEVEDFRQGIINGSITVPGSLGGTTLTEKDVSNFKPITFKTITNDMNMTTFASPDGSRDALWKFLNAANESIYVEVFGINHPDILELVKDIHTTKPWIDMKFLIGWNSIGYYSPNDYVANNLTLAGIPVKWTNSSDFTYAHQKFVVIDNKTTIVHSGNWAKTSFPDLTYDANREWNIALTDTEVADCYLSVFHKDWNRGTDYNATLHGTGSPLTDPTATSTYPRPFATAGEFSGVTSVTPIFSPETSLEGILWCINQARFTLDIQIPYFTNVGDGGQVDEIVNAILAAKDRGVTVRVISEESYDWVEIEQILVEHGIPIVWMDTRWFTANHNKGIIVDGSIVLVSSINYSDNSIVDNREAGIIIQHEGVAQWFQDIFDFDWGIADADGMEQVNLYWSPNIPTSTDTTNVTVYTQQLYSDVTEVILGVKIGSGIWTNHTITSNVYPSSEGQLENYYYEIAPQPHGTRILVQAFVQALGVWHKGLNMTIHVLDSTIDYCDVDNPSDIYYEEGTIGNEIVWSPSALTPDKYIIFQDNVSIDSGDWDGSQISWIIDGLVVDTYNFTIMVNDTLGDTAISTVWVNVLPPEAPIITGPSDLEMEIGTTGWVVEWEGEDVTPHSYEIFRNDTSQISNSWSASPWTFNFSLDGLELGVYNFTLYLEDGLGNSASDTIWVTVVDTTDPTFIGIPVGFTYEYGSTPSYLRWYADDLTLDSFELLLNSVHEMGGDLTAPMDSITYYIDTLQPNEYNITVIIWDVAGNSNSHTVYTTIVDTTDPTVSHPDDISFVVGTTGQSITWSGNDLLTWNYSVYRDTVQIMSNQWNSSSESITVDLDDLAVGEYTFTLTLWDTSGNSVTDTVIVTVTEEIITTTSSSTTSTTTNTTTGTYTGTSEGTPLEQIVMIAIGAVVVLIGILCGVKKKR